MDKFVMPNKLSKKEQKARAAKSRNTWGMSPVTRVVQSKKVYTRKGRTKQQG